jgi:hypothetical protein
MEVVRPPGAWDPHRLPDARRRPGAWDPHSPARCLGSSQCPGMPLHTPKPPGSGRQRTRVPAAARPRALSKCQRTRVPTARLQGPFPMPADAHPPAAHLRGPFPMPALSRCPRTRGNGPFPNARGSASPLQLPDAQGCASPPPPAPGEDARPRRCAPPGPFPDVCGWVAAGKHPGGFGMLRTPSSNRRPPPGGFGVRPATTVSLQAALACVRTPSGNGHLPLGGFGVCLDGPPCRPPPGSFGVRPDARQPPSPSGRLGHASRRCPATLPPGGLGVRTHAKPARRRTAVAGCSSSF